jgi:hypothetical protein
MQMVIGWLALGGLVAVVAVALLRFERRAKDDDLGTVSGQWINEERSRGVDSHR